MNIYFPIEIYHYKRKAFITEYSSFSVWVQLNYMLNPEFSKEFLIWEMMSYNKLSFPNIQKNT